MNILSKPQLGLSGQYKIEVKRNGVIIKETDWFDNLITNNGLNFLGELLPRLKCRVGTGTNAPNVLDVALSNEIASTFLKVDQFNNVSNPATSVTNSLEPNFITSYIYTCKFAQGAVVGNVTEVGLGASTGNLFSRALITDSNGVPTALTFLAIDQLTLYYKLTITPILSETTGSVTINSATYNYTCLLTNPAGAFNTTDFLEDIWPGGGAYFKTASLVNLGFVGITPIAYVNGTYSKGFRITCPINLGNDANGIKIIDVTIGSSGTFRYTFNTPIMKTDTQVLTLDLTRSWGRG